MTDFSGRVLLLTGASGGIGRAIARAFYRAGAAMVLADLRQESLDELVRELGERAVALRYDASAPEDATAAVALCLQRFGRLDFLVPAAAIYEEHSFLTMTDDDWRRTMAVNVDGVFYICRRAVPEMPPGSAIVTIASEAAHSGPSVRHAHYGTSKGAVLTLTRSLARELAPDIRVNTVSPGTIDTPMVKDLLRTRGADTFLRNTPMGRLGTPDEVADAVVFLCSDAARYITGQAIHVNGGSYIGG